MLPVRADTSRPAEDYPPRVDEADEVEQVDEAEQQLPVIALVASGGGVPALTAVLGHLPANLPAALVVILHQAPTTGDLLAQTLQPHTPLVLQPAVDGTPLQAGVVHLPPGGHHLLVTCERTLLLIEAGPVPPARPSADLLLTSLALAVGPDAIAVVLSGRGSDGATGASVVHRCGGLVIAATADASTCPDMPRATAERDSITAQVLDPGAIADALVRAVSAR